MARGSSVPPPALLDLETRAAPSDHAALRVWLRLLATTNLIEKRVRRKLEDQFDTTLPRFDLMAQLHRAPDGLKMSELSKRMMVSGGKVTGIADSLERDGMIRRIPDPRDGRASLLRLTESGRRQFRAMADRHERWIVEVFAELGDRDITELAALLARLKTSARGLEDQEVDR